MTALPAITTPLDATPRVYTDTEARIDLSRHNPGPQPDDYWATRWGWRTPSGHLDIQGVIRLRLGGARDADLPAMYDRHLSPPRRHHGRRR